MTIDGEGEEWGATRGQRGSLFVPHSWMTANPRWPQLGTDLESDPAIRAGDQCKYRPPDTVPPAMAAVPDF